MPDTFFFPYQLPKEITLVYGEAGTGKTTFALQASLPYLQEKQKVFFIDTENGFSPERFKQMIANIPSLDLNNLLMLHARDFAQQHQHVLHLVSIAQKFKLIVIDTIGNHYRKEVVQHKELNSLMDRQLRLLFEVSKHTPVLLTNQVSSNMEGGVNSVGKNMILKWCNSIIELRKKPRTMAHHKPQQKTHLFNITDQGIIPL